MADVAEWERCPEWQEDASVAGGFIADYVHVSKPIAKGDSIPCANRVPVGRCMHAQSCATIRFGLEHSPEHRRLRRKGYSCGFRIGRHRNCAGSACDEICRDCVSRCVRQCCVSRDVSIGRRTNEFHATGGSIQTQRVSARVQTICAVSVAARRMQKWNSRYAARFIVEIHNVAAVLLI